MHGGPLRAAPLWKICEIKRRRRLLLRAPHRRAALLRRIIAPHRRRVVGQLRGLFFLLLRRGAPPRRRGVAVVLHVRHWRGELALRRQRRSRRRRARLLRFDLRVASPGATRLDRRRRQSAAVKLRPCIPIGSVRVRCDHTYRVLTGDDATPQAHLHGAWHLELGLATRGDLEDDDAVRIGVGAMHERDHAELVGAVAEAARGLPAAIGAARRGRDELPLLVQRRAHVLLEALLAPAQVFLELGVHRRLLPGRGVRILPFAHCACGVGGAARRTRLGDAPTVSGSTPRDESCSRRP
mmetsp:Transcript_27293/g.85935  ORF Transcript_27293/g.85935 Transcript_27293/m.85935 type:complete len:296 (+) Transcript_27293:1188-2075(+)